MKQTVKKLLFMLGIMCLTIFGKETSTTVLADNLDEIENYTIYAEPDWEDGSVYLKYDITWKVLDSTQTVLWNGLKSVSQIRM